MVTKRTQGENAPPMLIDALQAQDEIADGDAPPKELNASENFLVFSRPGKSKALDIERNGVRLVEGFGNVLTPSTDDAVLGHLGAELLRVPIPKKDAKVAATLEPYLPKWSGTAFAPRAATPPRERWLRRRNGARVRPEWVFPPDNRQVYFPSSYPWRIVGRIFVWSNANAASWTWWGTASLVGRRTIMTASHVVPWGSSNWKALFVPGYYDGVSANGANAASWVTNARGYADHGQGDDMAVMRLAQPLGDWLGYFGYKTYNDDWEDIPAWTLCGYPFDVAGGNRPCAVVGFPITDDDNDGAGVELEYRADSEGGSSGGPVFGWWNNKPYVVGTHSGGEDNFGEPRQNVAAGGAALSNLIKWGRDNWA